MSAQVVQKVQHFFSQYPEKTFTTGEVLIRPDASVNEIFYITSGSVRMYVISPDGEEVTLHIFTSDTYIPVMVLLSSSVNRYYFEATEQTITRVCPSPQMRTYLLQEPDVLFDLASRLSHALSGFSLRIEQLSTQQTSQRLVQVLLYLGNRFGKKEGESIQIVLRVSHEDLANWIGVRRETVSREMEKLEREKIVEICKKELVIKDMNRLKEYSLSKV